MSHDHIGGGHFGGGHIGGHISRGHISGSSPIHHISHSSHIARPIINAPIHNPIHHHTPNVRLGGYSPLHNRGFGWGMGLGWRTFMWPHVISENVYFPSYRGAARYAVGGSIAALTLSAAALSITAGITIGILCGLGVISLPLGLSLAIGLTLLGILIGATGTTVGTGINWRL